MDSMSLIFKDHEGTLWFATQYGLSVLTHNGQSYTLGKEEGLSKAIKIVIHPPFWDTLAARVFYAIITGHTPTDFIRSIRLKRAAQLLQGSQLPIVEIANRVGFSSPSYFSKCF